MYRFICSVLFISSLLFSCRNAAENTPETVMQNDIMKASVSPDFEELIGKTKAYYISQNKGSKNYETEITDSTIILTFPDELGDSLIMLGMSVSITLPNNPEQKDLSSGDIILGDLNGDHIQDAILVTTYSMASGNYNTYKELVTFVGNNDNHFELVCVTSERDLTCKNEMFPDYFTPLKIENGYLIGEKLCHSESDPHCCPSVKVEGKAVLKGNKLVPVSN